MNRFKYIATEVQLPACFSKKIMHQNIYFDGQTIVLAKWIDEMPSEYRDMAKDAATKVFDKYYGKKMVVRTLSNIIDDIYDIVNQEFSLAK